MNSKSGISAVIITKNEEKNIGRCLKSVSDLVDEIIIVDSYSTDNTKEIAESFGAKFFYSEWLGYAGSKNLANSYATNKYILSLDADEELSKELTSSIKKNINEGLNGVYRMNRLSNYCGQWIKHCGWYPDRKIRLFPKETSQWVGDHVHETMEFKGDPKVNKLEGHLLHYSYYSVEEHLERIKKYSKLGALKLAEKNISGGRFKAMYKAVARFISCYVFRLGFLDGYYGWLICKNTGYAIYLKYIYLNEIRKEKSGS